MVVALLMVGVVMLSCNLQLAEASEDVSVVSEAGKLGWLKAFNLFNLSRQVRFFPFPSPHLFIYSLKQHRTKTGQFQEELKLVLLAVLSTWQASLLMKDLLSQIQRRRSFLA